MGAMLGIAMGDAMGMPSQSLSRAEIRAIYGCITDFRDAAADHPVSGGLRAGTITDDMEQSLLLAQHLVDLQGRFDERRWAHSLLDWEKETHARGVNDLLGPSTKRAIDALLRGMPASETGRFGTTNGAAMRIVPVGICTPTEPLRRFIRAVEETCRLTHNTSEAIGSAAAVAAIASAGVDGARFEDAIPVALEAAREGERHGTPATSGSISTCIEKALALASAASGQEAANRIAQENGSGVAAVESIAMAFAIVRLAHNDPWQAAVLSANIGGDTDTIGAIACGMASACSGLSSLPKAGVDFVVSVNGLNLAPVVNGLLDIRNTKARGPSRLGKTS
jgi:ADP-ribosylglycohydrolase